MRLSEFAERVGGRIENPADDLEIRGISTLERAGEGDLSFVIDKKYAAQAELSRASAIIIPDGFSLPGKTTVSMREPWGGVLFLLKHLYADRGGSGIQQDSGLHKTAVVDPTATIAADAVIGPHAVIGPRVTVGARSIVGPQCTVGADCKIGQDCLLHASVSVMSETEIGDRVILHPGVVIGADGFKYEVIGGRWTKIPQVGRVVIEDDVEIGANSCVDRASFTETRIGRNTKIDNLVQIAHNVQIGSDCIIVSQVGIAGSTRIGNGVIVAAQAGIADNLRIGNNVRVLARSAVKDHIEDGQTILGAPARPFRLAAKIMAAEGQLPELVAELNRLKKRVAELEARGK